MKLKYGIVNMNLNLIKVDFRHWLIGGLVGFGTNTVRGDVTFMFKMVGDVNPFSPA